MFAFNPPHTECDSQKEVFNQQQTPFLFKSAKSKFQNSTGFQKALEECLSTNSVGGCLSFFDGVRIFQRDFDSLSSQCRAVVSEISEVRHFFDRSLDLFVRLAWGTDPSMDKTQIGWLDNAHVYSYCRLRSNYLKYYGQDQWSTFAEKQLSELPNAKEMGREQAWVRSLLSLACEKFR